MTASLPSRGTPGAALAHVARRAARCAPICAALCWTLAACMPRDDAKRDTTTVLPSPEEIVRTPPDTTGAAAGVPAVPNADSAVRAAVDSGVVWLHPERPRRGGVLFAIVEGVAVETPRCSWKGQPLACHRVPQGVLAIVPLPAHEPAGTFTLAVERPAGRVTRQVAVDDRAFERELVVLDAPRSTLVGRTRDIARDARLLQRLVGTHTPARLWRGRWRAPLEGKAAGYGVERLYLRAADSARAIALNPTWRAADTFVTDTSAPRAELPAWRHDGVDIAARRGTSVRAPAAGVVLDVGDYTLTGRALLIDHGQGVVSAYFHLDTVLVQEGDEVRPRQPLARVGATGLATHPHLHYAVYIHGEAVEPAAWQAMPPVVRGDSAPPTR